MALIHEPPPKHRRYRHRPRLRVRESHPTIATRVLVAALMGVVLYLTAQHVLH